MALLLNRLEFSSSFVDLLFLPFGFTRKIVLRLHQIPNIRMVFSAIPSASFVLSSPYPLFTPPSPAAYPHIPNRKHCTYEVGTRNKFLPWHLCLPLLRSHAFLQPCTHLHSYPHSQLTTPRFFDKIRLYSSWIYHFPGPSVCWANRDRALGHRNWIVGPRARRPPSNFRVLS